MLTAPDLNLRVELIPAGKHNRPGSIIRPTAITIHNTDNPDHGADAEAHSSFVRKTGFYLLNGSKHWVSWHFTVDDKVAIKHLPLNELAYHAGSGNAVSIAIEICMNNGIDQVVANLRAALLTAGLLKDLNITIDNIVPHKKWTGKNCPQLLLDDAAIGAKWRSFIESIRSFQVIPQVLTREEVESFESKEEADVKRSTEEDLIYDID